MLGSFGHLLPKDAPANLLDLFLLYFRCDPILSFCNSEFKIFLFINGKERVFMLE